MARIRKWEDVLDSWVADSTPADVDTYERQLKDAEEPIAPQSRTLTWLALAVGAFLLAFLIGIPVLQFVALSAVVVLALRAIDYMDRRR